MVTLVGQNLDLISYCNRPMSSIFVDLVSVYPRKLNLRL